MFEDWATGMGPGHRDFGPGSPELQDLQNSYVMEQARNKFYNEFNAGRECGDYISMPSIGMGFGLSGALKAGLNPTQQFSAVLMSRSFQITKTEL